MKLAQFKEWARSIASRNHFKINKLLYAGHYYDRTAIRNVIYAGAFKSRPAII